MGRLLPPAPGAIFSGGFAGVFRRGLARCLAAMHFGRAFDREKNLDDDRDHGREPAG